MVSLLLSVLMLALITAGGVGLGLLYFERKPNRLLWVVPATLVLMFCVASWGSRATMAVIMPFFIVGGLLSLILTDSVRNRPSSKVSQLVTRLK